MIPRTAERTIRKLLKGFPLVTVTGPRQSGKTVTGEAFAALERWRALAGKAGRKPTLVHGGTDCYRRNGVDVVDWRESGGVLA